jgi:Family of unknown function (DUF6452)
MKFIAAILISVFFICSCQDQYSICELPKTVDCKAGFYQYNRGVETSVNASAFSLYIINSAGFFYNQQPNLSKFQFSLNPSVDSLKYFIKVGDILLADTLTLTYTSQNTLISPECGNVFIHTLLKINSTLNTIDSIKIINSNLNTTTGENLKIYF